MGKIRIPLTTWQPLLSFLEKPDSNRRICRRRHTFLGYEIKLMINSRQPAQPESPKWLTFTNRSLDNLLRHL